MLTKYFLLALIISFVFAKLEIQIEGKNGWAKELPTWRFYKPWFRYIPGANKPLTGYHFYFWILLFLLLQLTFLFQKWSLGKELILLSFLILILKVEDFLWFILNPHYGIKKFRKKNIPWHNAWFLSVPIQYWISIITWLILLSLGLKLEKFS